MSFNGTGTFVRIENWTLDAANGILIRSDRMDTDSNDFASGLSNCICKDGQQTTTARIPFGVGLSVNQGSISTPSITVAGDTATGFYQTALGELRFTSGGSYKATLNANGLDNTSVGAGTASTGAFTTLAATSMASTGAITGTSSITLGANSGTIGSVLLNGSTSGVTTIVPNVAAGSGTLTLPVATDTLIGKATTDTLTNKTYDTAGTGNSFKVNGTALTAVTGTGAVVLASAPTLTNPVVGTQTALDSSTKAASTAFVSSNAQTCKAWVNFDATGGTINVRASFNIASVVRNTTGDYTVNFTNNMANISYSTQITASGHYGTSNAVSLLNEGPSGTEFPPTISAFRFCLTFPSGGGVFDSKYICVTIFGT